MLERYTGNARRAIFFSGYEARLFGSRFIESEHLLLGLIRANRPLLHYLLHPACVANPARSAEDLHTAILAAAPKRGNKSTNADLPLSDECKRILFYGEREAERMELDHVNVEHLLIGIVFEGNCLAAELLRQRGLELNKFRSALRVPPVQQVVPKYEALTTPPLTEAVNAIIDKLQSSPPPQPRRSWLSGLLRRFGKAQ